MIYKERYLFSGTTQPPFGTTKPLHGTNLPPLGTEKPPLGTTRVWEGGFDVLTLFFVLTFIRKLKRLG